MALTLPNELKKSLWTTKKGKTAPDNGLGVALGDVEIAYGTLRQGPTEKRYQALKDAAKKAADLARQTHGKCKDRIHAATQMLCLSIAGKASEFADKVDVAYKAHITYIAEQLTATEKIIKNLKATQAETVKALAAAKTLARTPARTPAGWKKTAGTMVKNIEALALAGRKEFGKYQSVSSSSDKVTTEYRKLAIEAEDLFKDIQSMALETKTVLKPLV